MDDNLESPTKINIEDFINIYPPIIPFVNNSQLSNKFIKLFSFENSMRKASTAIQRKFSRQLINTNNILSLSNIFNINSIDSKDKNNINNKNDTLINMDKERNKLENTEYYLLLKAIELQNNNKKRPSYIKNALGQFFSKSDLISKLSNFFKKYGLNTSNEIPNINEFGMLRMLVANPLLRN